MNRLLINKGSFLRHDLGEPFLVLRFGQSITVTEEESDWYITLNVREVDQRRIVTAVDPIVFALAEIELPQPLILKAVNLSVVQNRVKARSRWKMAQKNQESCVITVYQPLVHQNKQSQVTDIRYVATEAPCQLVKEF